MQKIIRQKIIPEATPDNLTFLKKRLQWLFLLRVVFLSILLGLNLLLQSTEQVLIVPPLNYITAFIAGVYIFTIISAFLLSKIKLLFFAYAQIMVDVTLTSLLVFYSGGSQSIFTPLFFFPIIAGSFILLRRGGLAAAAASTICYGTVLILEYQGLYPIFFEEYWYKPLSNILVVMNFFSINGLSFFLAALLSILLSERLRKAEKALSQASLQFDGLTTLYKQIFDDISTGIIITDGSGNISSMNRAAELITGDTAALTINRKLTEKIPALKQERNRQDRAVINLRRHDGVKIPVACSFTKLHMPEGCDDCRIITLQDLSEIKKMEKQVSQAEKMAAIGEMAAGIAHEFRNPLAAISGSAEVLKKEIENTQTNNMLLDIIIRESSRLENNIADFLQFSKPSSPEKELVQLDEMVYDILLLLKQAKDWGENCHALAEVPEKQDCWVDPQQLNQILINLLHNSCMAMGGENGEIHISAGEKTTEDGKEMTVIRVIDTGCGIPAENMDRIFEPFFTTRENGTGLGLAIVRQLIESHNGTIHVASEPGQGTTFEISLPLP